jgi:hypothetical protein
MPPDDHRTLVTVDSNQPPHLMLDYRPSQWTGWECGKTIGGHHPSGEFTLAGRHYQIQVAQWKGAGCPGSAPYVDNTECPNPFFISGGLISILGTRVFNFDNPITAQLSQSPGDNRVLSARYLAEVFLARDTATKDAAGKDVIEIFAGLKYGCQLQEVTR